MNRKFLRCSKDAEANDMIHMLIPAPKKKDSQNRFKKWRKNSATESIESQTSEEVKYEETTRYEERYRELKRKIMQEDVTTAACKQAEDEPAATSEHVEGHNEATAAADKRKDEAANK